MTTVSKGMFETYNLITEHWYNDDYTTGFCWFVIWSIPCISSDMVLWSSMTPVMQMMQCVIWMAKTSVGREWSWSTPSDSGAMLAADLEEVRDSFTYSNTILHTKSYFSFIGTSFSLADVGLMPKLHFFRLLKWRDWCSTCSL